MEREGELAAPDLLVFETLAVLRRETLCGRVPGGGAAVEDLGDLAVELFPSVIVRRRAWELRNKPDGSGRDLSSPLLSGSASRSPRRMRRSRPPLGARRESKSWRLL